VLVIEKIPSFTWLEAVVWLQFVAKTNMILNFKLFAHFSSTNPTVLKFIKDSGKQFMLQDFVEAEGPWLDFEAKTWALECFTNHLSQ